MRIVSILFVFAAFFGQTSAQSTAFVLGGGPSLGFQRWDNSFDRQPLLKYHATLGIETVNNDNDNSALFAQFGYHVRGSATRFRSFLGIGNPIVFKEEFLFHNLALVLGAKQKFQLGPKSRYFYFAGVRGEYTMSTNLEDLTRDRDQFFRILYPFDGAVNHWMVGASAGGGLEFPFGELVGGQLTFSVNPDFLLQYNQPAIGNVIDPFNPGQSINIPERRIRNVTLELTLALRLIRKVVYE